MMVGLVWLGVLPRKQLESCIYMGRVYIADVPSLNKKATMRSVVIDTRDVMKVFDPQSGRNGKEWYTDDMLTAWANLVRCERVEH